MIRLFAIVMLALCALFAGCGRDTPVEEATRAGVLLLGNGPEPVALDPHITTGTSELNIHMALFEGLVAPDPRTLAPEPGVAERWESSADGMLWTFHLRADARWSDGQPVTAADFLFAWQRILSPALGAANASLLFDIDGAEAFNRGTATDFASVGVSAPDPRTLVVRLRHPAPYFLNLLMHPAFYPVRRDVIAATGDPFDRSNRWHAAAHVGNGPFMFGEWLRGQWVEVIRNPHYWDAPRVALNAIRFKTFDDAGTEERAFFSGQLHATERIAPGRVDALRERHPEMLRIDPYLGTYYYLLNCRRAPLDDPRVRRALALALDRSVITDRLLRGGQTPASSFTPANVPGYTPPRGAGFDPAAARALLAEAGFPDGTGFPRMEILFNTSESHRLIAEAVQDMWRRHLGIEILLTNQEVGVYFESRALGNFDIARAVWIGDYLAPETFLHLWTSSSGNNFSGWADPAYDALIARAAAAAAGADPTTRMELLREAERRLLDQQPVIPVYHYAAGYLLRPEVKGWHPTLLDWHPYKYLSLEP